MSKPDVKDTFNALINAAKELREKEHDPDPEPGTGNFHLYDPNYHGNQISGSFPTLLEAVTAASELLAEFKKEASSGQEWDAEVEDIKVIFFEPASTLEECEIDGIICAKVIPINEEVFEGENYADYTIVITPEVTQTTAIYSDIYATVASLTTNGKNGSNPDINLILNPSLWAWTDSGGYNAGYRYSTVDPTEDSEEVEMQGAEGVAKTIPYVLLSDAQKIVDLKDAAIASLKNEIETLKGLLDPNLIDILDNNNSLTIKLNDSKKINADLQLKIDTITDGLSKLLDDVKPTKTEEVREPDINDWFLSLPTEHQKAIRDDKWLLAGQAYQAGVEAGKKL